MTLKCVKLHPEASLPVRAHEFDAGADCKAVSKQFLDSSNNNTQNTSSAVNVVYDLGIGVEVPKGYMLMVAARSSSYKNNMSLASSVGIVDYGYQGSIRAIFRLNAHSKPYLTTENVIQLVLVPIETPTFEWGEFSEVTERGEGGFGSTTKEDVSEVKTFTINEVSFDMIYVEGGTFRMGGTEEQEDEEEVYSEDDEEPVHTVTLSNFSIGKYQVTQELWQAVMGSNPSKNKQGGNYPVENVSWHDCQEFIAKLNTLTGKWFSLPTEAQWEFAARGGIRTQCFMYAGSNNLDEVCWYDDNSSNTTHLVGEKKSNELGIYDMNGNVLEWCVDGYSTYESSPKVDPIGFSSDNIKVKRGGSYWDCFRECRTTCRDSGISYYNDTFTGMRLVLNLD